MKAYSSKLILLALVSAAVTAHAGDVDKSRKVDVDVIDSFNRTTEIDTDINNSRKVEDSFNRRTETNTDIDTRIDNSRAAYGSFNRATDNSTRDSFNRYMSVRTDTKIDTQTVSPTVNTSKYVSTLDTQSASNSGKQVGAHQGASLGDINLGGVGNEYSAAPSNRSGGFFSPATMTENRSLTQSNVARVEGSNYGVVYNGNIANQGSGDLVQGPKGSIVNSDIGHKLAQSADQTQLQNNTQDKQSATSSTASDTVTTSASK